MKRKAISSARIERWLGAEKAEKLSRDMKGWYGPPINLRDLPGSVWIGRDGDFCGDFDRGFFDSAEDAFGRMLNREAEKWKRALHPDILAQYAGAGFASISDALARASSGDRQLLNGQNVKIGVTGVTAACMTLWQIGGMPGSGAAGSAAPGGRAPTKATTGAMAFNNPATGTLHLTGADYSASVTQNSLMLYDRIFDVAKNMNSTATESVTGVPTRYQSSTATDPNYAGGNFLFIECFTVLPATAHNWTTCLYRDDAGNDAQTLPSVTGNASCIAHRFDMPVNSWFCPLATGDVGIMDLNQIQCSALVASGAINFVIGHPIGIMAFPFATMMFPFDWLTNRDQAPRIFDDACLSTFELPKPGTTACTYNGQIYATRAAP